MARPWRWTSEFNSSADQPKVDSPEKYTIAFAVDGTVAVTADCNQASGTYTVGANNALTITLGPATAAACGDGSRSEEFLKLLGTATSYLFSGDQLFVVLVPGTAPFALVFERE